jgi:hypothetical protein
MDKRTLAVTTYKAYESKVASVVFVIGCVGVFSRVFSVSWN